jgi:hypothetical protein
MTEEWFEGQSAAVDEGCSSSGIGRTTSHLLPSRASFGGFLPASAAGFVGRTGFLAAAGTTADARSSGFLCVISLLSTFLRPLVTSPPSSANRPPPPPFVGAVADSVVAGAVKDRGS